MLMSLSCGDTSDEPLVLTTDATRYFPVEEGRYWILFDASDQFLTLAFDREVVLGGHTAEALVFTMDYDTTSGDPIGPLFELYLASEGESTRTYGWQDFRTGLAVSLLPGGIFASDAMPFQSPVLTSTAANGIAATYASTLADEGVIQSYYGEFPDGIRLETGLETGGESGGEPGLEGASADVASIVWFLAAGVGPVKLDWQGVRYQLYDFGQR